MKVLIRVMGLCIISILMIVIIINLMNINTIINELNNVSALAIINAQEFAIETMTSKLEDINNNTYVVHDAYTPLEESSNEYKILNNKYKQEFINYFNSSVNDKDIYDINLIESNIQEGIIHVSIKCNKYKFIRDKELLNKVEYNEGYQHPTIISKEPHLSPIFEYYVIDESKKYEIPSGTNFNYLLKNKTWPKTIYTWEFDDYVTVGDYYISAYSCINTAYDIKAAYWYPGLRLSALDKDGSWIVINQKSQNKYTGQKTLEGNTSIKTKKVILEVTEYKPKTGYEAKVNKFAISNSYIGEGRKIYKEVLDWETVIEEVYEQGSRLVYYDYDYHYKEINSIYLERLS